MPPSFSAADRLNGSDLDAVTYFALTDSRGKRVPFGIKKRDRDRHTYVIGKTGMGKSTLLENMAVQDIQRGEGICFIDPHGSTAEKLLDYVPEHRVKDVLYFAPFDLQYPISFNVLENVDADKRHLVVAGLMSTFEKIWVDAWSARMAYILQNTLGALLEFPGATLLGVNRMYIDKEYRKNVIAKITDPSVRSFWVDEYTKYTDRYTQEATPAIQNKIGQFASNALVRNVIGQEQSSFNIRDLMDSKKIFIVNLSKGRVGEGNANLLGSMLITKIYLAAMSRADTAPGVLSKLPYFYLHVDEFQNFANKSFADILSEARKYKLALTIAHQYVEQMEEEVASAVFGNVGTMITFRVGAYDAEVLEKEYAPTFEMEDLVNLGARQIYLKLMIDGVSSQPFSAVTMPPIPEPEVNHRDRAIAYSRAQFSRPRAEVEKSISDWVAQRYEDPEAPAKEAAREERRSLRASEGERPAQNFERRPAAPSGFRPQPRFERPQAPVQSASQAVRTWTNNTPRPSTTSAAGALQRPPRPQEPRGEERRMGEGRSEERRFEERRPVPPAVRLNPPLTPSVHTPPAAGGLRDLLTRVTPPSPGVGVTPQHVRPRDENTPRLPLKSERAEPQAFPRTDTKGVTPEGREGLRELLAAVAQKKTVSSSTVPARPEAVAPAPNAPPVSPRPAFTSPSHNAATGAQLGPTVVVPAQRVASVGATTVKPQYAQRNEQSSQEATGANPQSSAPTSERPPAQPRDNATEQRPTQKTPTHGEVPAATLQTLLHVDKPPTT